MRTRSTTLSRLLLYTVLMFSASLASPTAFNKENSIRVDFVSVGQINDTQATDAGFHTRGSSVAHFSFDSYRAANGDLLTVLYHDFDTPEEARRFFEWKVGRAFKVLAQEDKTDAASESTLYRAEFVPERDHSQVELMWVGGGSVHIVRARNLEYARGLEKLYRRFEPCPSTARSAKRGE